MLSQSVPQSFRFSPKTKSPQRRRSLQGCRQQFQHITQSCHEISQAQMRHMHVMSGSMVKKPSIRSKKEVLECYSKQFDELFRQCGGLVKVRVPKNYDHFFTRRLIGTRERIKMQDTMERLLLFNQGQDISNMLSNAMSNSSSAARNTSGKKEELISLLQGLKLMKNLNNESTDKIQTEKVDSLSPEKDKGLGALHIQKVSFKERVYKHTNIQISNSSAKTNRSGLSGDDEFQIPFQEKPSYSMSVKVSKQEYQIQPLKVIQPKIPVRLCSREVQVRKRQSVPQQNDATIEATPLSNFESTPRVPETAIVQNLKPVLQGLRPKSKVILSHIRNQSRPSLKTQHTIEQEIQTVQRKSQMNKILNNKQNNFSGQFSCDQFGVSQWCNQTDDDDRRGSQMSLYDKILHTTTDHRQGFIHGSIYQ